MQESLSNNINNFENISDDINKAQDSDNIVFLKSKDESIIKTNEVNNQESTDLSDYSPNVNYLNQLYQEFLKGNSETIDSLYPFDSCRINFNEKVQYIDKGNFSISIPIEVDKINFSSLNKIKKNTIDNSILCENTLTTKDKQNKKKSISFNSFRNLTFLVALISAIILFRSWREVDKTNQKIIYNPIDKSNIFHLYGDEYIKRENPDLTWNSRDFNFPDNCLDIPPVKMIKKKPLNNQRRFILGKCNPVIFVPGFMGTRLVASFNCPELVKDEEKLKELRYFCKNSICKEPLFGGYNVEEYTLWPALFNSPFKLFQDSENNKNSCAAYISRHHNDENECPKDLVLNKQICLYNKNIQISFFGDTPKTRTQSQCGTRAVSLIVDSGYSIIPEYLTNSESTQGFYKLTKILEQKGYSLGFSMAAVPYDWRKFYVANNHFQENFKKMVGMLYKNTGKKVVVISHSFGNLNVLRLLNKKSSLTNKIKHYMAVAPSFLGTPKILELFWTGTHEFRTEIMFNQYIDLTPQAQRFSTFSMPGSYALKPKANFHQIAQLEKYKEFIEALKERIDLEKNCGILSQNYDNLCTIEYLIENSKKFKKIFPFFPQFDSDFCQNIRKKILKEFYTQEFLNYKESARDDIYEFLPSYEGCEIRIFDYLRCPLIKILKEENLNKRYTLEDFHNICFENYNEIDSEQFIFNHDCTLKPDSQNCLLNFIRNHTTFNVKEYFSKEGQDSDFPESLLISLEEYQRGLELMTQQIHRNETLEEFDSPLMPTSVIFSSFIDTRSSYIFNITDPNHNHSKNTLKYFGGDGNVPTYSSLLPAMKWIYDNQVKDNKNHIQIVNYCSQLANNTEFLFDPTNKTESKHYIALNCECLSEKGYDLSSLSTKIMKCSHVSILSDTNVINFIYITSSNEPTYNKIEDYSKDIRKAFLHGFNLDYEEICNKILHDFE